METSSNAAPWAPWPPLYLPATIGSLPLFSARNGSSCPLPCPLLVHHNSQNPRTPVHPSGSSSPAAFITPALILAMRQAANQVRLIQRSATTPTRTKCEYMRPFPLSALSSHTHHRCTAKTFALLAPPRLPPDPHRPYCLPARASSFILYRVRCARCIRQDLGSKSNGRPKEGLMSAFPAAICDLPSHA